MKGKLLLLAAVVVAVLALGSVIAWAATDRGDGSQPQPVWTHSPSDRDWVRQMHRGLDKGDLDGMVRACTEAMKGGHIMDADDLDGHDMDGMMGGGMMGGGMR